MELGIIKTLGSTVGPIPLFQNAQKVITKLAELPRLRNPGKDIKHEIEIVDCFTACS